MKKTFIDYDKEADVCYISFHTSPLEADDSHAVGDFIFRSKSHEPIGVTIINFSKYKNLIKLLYERSIESDTKRVPELCTLPFPLECVKIKCDPLCSYLKSDTKRTVKK